MSTKLYRTVSFFVAIAFTLMACSRPPAPLAPTATAAPTEAPTAVPTMEPALTTTPVELACDWIGQWEYVKTYWSSIDQGFSFYSYEMAPAPQCANVVSVFVPGRGSFNFFYFRAASGNWFVSPPIEALWGTDSLVYPISATSDGFQTHFVFYDLRNHESVDVLTDSEAVGLITHTPMSIEEATKLFPEQPCGLPKEIELVEQVRSQIPQEATVEWLKWTYRDCHAYSTLFVTNGTEATQYTWFSDGDVVWGPIARDGNMIPNVLRWTDNAVTMFDFLGSVWTVQIADDGSFNVINESQYNQVLFGAALDGELYRTSGPGYLEPLADVFPLESPVVKIDLEGWLTLPGDVQYLIAYYHVGEEWKEVVLFAKGDMVTNPIEFDADYIHYDWRVESYSDQTVVTSCTAGLTKETGNVNTFTIVGNTVTLSQKTGTCR